MNSSEPQFWYRSELGEARWFSILAAMSKYGGEKVLVVPRALLNEIGAFEGIRTDGLVPAVGRLLDAKNHTFMDRAAAEEDPSFKQLIPYCIFRCGDRILHYTRGKSGGEIRRFFTPASNSIPDNGSTFALLGLTLASITGPRRKFGL